MYVIRAGVPINDIVCVYCLLLYNLVYPWIRMSCLAFWSNQKPVKRYRTSPKTLFKTVISAHFLCRSIN